MAEGVAVAGKVAAAGVYDDPDSPPPYDPQRAPKGWTWRRGTGSWEPSKRMARGRGAVPPGDVSRETSPGPAAAAGPGDQAAGPEAPGPGQVIPGPGDQDPAPAWAGDPGDVSRETSPALAGGRPDFADVPQGVKDDITGLIGLAAVPVLSVLQALDPYCGSVLGDNLDPVAEAALPLICRSSRVVAYFADEGADWLLWGRLAVALKPVGLAIAEHHVFGRVELTRDPQTGARGWRRKDAAAAGPGGDHLTPRPQPEFRYAA